MRAHHAGIGSAFAVSCFSGRRRDSSLCGNAGRTVPRGRADAPRRPATAEPLEGRRLLAATAYEITELSLGGSFASVSELTEAGRAAGVSQLPADNVSLHAFLYAGGAVVDLDTLGGTYSDARDLNAAGQLVGTSSDEGNAFHAYLYDGGPLIDLGTLGGSASSAYLLNDAGHVVGNSYVANDASFHGFLYKDGQVTDLGTLGGTTTQPTHLNEAGQITGTSTTPDNAGDHAFLYDADTGEMRDLGTFGGYQSVPTALNEAGQVAGWAHITDDDVTDDIDPKHAFLYDGVEMIDLGTLGGNSEALFLNEAGHVAGFSYLEGRSGAFRAFLYDGAGMIDLGTLGGATSFPSRLNEAGQVVGKADTADDLDGNTFADFHAFLYDDGQMTDLGTLGGADSYANDVNDAGLVVGASSTAGGEWHAFLFADADDDGEADPGEMVDLNDLVPDDFGWVLQDAAMINEAGQIVAYGSYENRYVPFLLTPTTTNAAPTAVDDVVVTVEDNAANIGVLANDSDPDGDALAVSAVTDPAHGTAVVEEDGTVTYTPDPNYRGADSFTYTVDDGRGGTATAAVSVTVRSPAQGTQAVIDRLRALVTAGQLTQGQANSLIHGKLDAALKFMTGNKPSAAKAAHHLQQVLDRANVLPQPQRQEIVQDVLDLLAGLLQ